MSEKIRGIDPIEEALKSRKVESFLRFVYAFEGRKEDQDTEEPKVGLIVEVASDDVFLDGVLSKGERHQLLFVPYSEIPKIVNNPNVKFVDWGYDEILDLVRSSEGNEVVIKCSRSGSEGDDWDSPAYDNFWGPVEQNINKKIEILNKIGKQVKLV